MEYRRIFKDGVHLLAGKIGTAVIGAVNLAILARVLTTEEMGIYSLFLMVVNLALVVGLNWSDASIVRHGREEHVTSRKINKSFWARMYLFIPIVLLTTIILLLFRKSITSFIGIGQQLILLVIGVFLLNGILNFINHIYQSTDRMKKSAYVLLSQKALFVLSVGAVVLSGANANLATVLVLINASFLAAVMLNLLFFDFSKVRPYVFDKRYFKKIWDYSWPHFIGFPGLYIINYIDLYTIKRYMTLHDVGVYSMAYNGFIIISGILMVFYTVFFPLIVEYKTKKQHEKIKGYLKNIPLHTGIWVVLVLIGIACSRFVITTVLSMKYVESVAPFNILLIASIAYFITICLLPIVNAFDLIIYAQIFNLVKAGANVIADFTLVPKIGIMGAAYGTLITYTVGLLLTIILIAKKRRAITGVDA